LTEGSADKLVSKILEDARAQARGIISDAEDSSKKILEERQREAQEKARAACQEMLRAAEGEAENIIHRESVDTIIKTRWMLLSEKRKIIDNVFKKAEDKLRAIGSEDRYLQLLTRLIAEGAEAAGGGKLEILLNRTDTQLKIPLKDISKRVSSKLGRETILEISHTNITSKGGVIIQTTDGRTKIDSTLESILERERRRLEPRISDILFSGRTK
jgi:vacuolar-type H+-ATPase subunit E/Vma4